jgi:hypothetical protein
MMGCDIHGVVERFWNDKWVAFNTLSSIHGVYGRQPGGFDIPLARSRNYERFAALAGVRGDGPEARGLPEDASDTSKMLFDLIGDHTPSWLPIEEAAAIFIGTERYPLDSFQKSFPLNTYFGMDERDGPPSQFRLVFWFDS